MRKFVKLRIHQPILGGGGGRGGLGNCFIRLVLVRVDFFAIVSFMSRGKGNQVLDPNVMIEIICSDCGRTKMI